MLVNNIDKCSIGETAQDRIYLGSTLIWEKGSSESYVPITDISEIVDGGIYVLEADYLDDKYYIDDSNVEKVFASGELVTKKPLKIIYDKANSAFKIFGTGNYLFRTTNGCTVRDAYSSTTNGYLLGVRGNSFSYEITKSLNFVVPHENHLNPETFTYEDWFITVFRDYEMRFFVSQGGDGGKFHLCKIE